MATLKQKKALALLAENGGNVSKAMRDAGYSAVSASTPKKLTNSKAFQDLFAKKVPDSLLAQRHLDLLNKKETKMVFDHQVGGFVTETTDAPDTQAVKAGLDMAYKLKGHYAPEKSLNVNMNGTLADLVNRLEHDGG